MSNEKIRDADLSVETVKDHYNSHGVNYSTTATIIII